MRKTKSIYKNYSRRRWITKPPLPSKPRVFPSPLYHRVQTPDVIVQTRAPTIFHGTISISCNNWHKWREYGNASLHAYHTNFRTSSGILGNIMTVYIRIYIYTHVYVYIHIYYIVKFSPIQPVWFWAVLGGKFRKHALLCIH